MQWRFLFAGSGTAAQLLLPASRQAGVTHCNFRNNDRLLSRLNLYCLAQILAHINGSII